MNILISLIVIIGTMVAALHFRSTLRRMKRKHAIEYYLGWGGYWHPIGLQNRITKEEADAYAARGAVYLIGYYDANGRLMRVVKYLRGAVFFEYLYTYHPNGKLQSARVMRGGRDTLLEYDKRGRRVSDARTAL